MAMENGYRDRIAQYDWGGLQALWQRIEQGSTEEDGWEKGKAMEYLVLQAFRLDGAEVQWPFRVTIEGKEAEEIDGAVYCEGLACLVECKDRDGKANFEPIAKLRSQLLRRPTGAIGCIFSREGFTDPAVTLARFTAPQTILLWGGPELAHAILKRCMRRFLLAKYRHCVEYAYPNFDILMEDVP